MKMNKKKNKLKHKNKQSGSRNIIMKNEEI